MKRIISLLVLLLNLSFVLAQEIELTGNGNIIPIDGSNVTQTSDGTYFGTIVLGSSSIHTFIVKNISGSRIKAVVTSNNNNFATVFTNGTIQNERTKDLTITFNPTSNNLSEAKITIQVENGSSYIFNVSGNNNVLFGDVMISQYYNNGIAETIEITNLTAIDISAGDIFYRSNGISVALGAIQANETITANITNGNTNEIELVNNLGNVLDIIGDNSDWGSDISFTKGACATELPHISYNINDWIELEVAEVTVSANSNKNIDVGTYNVGATVWNGLWNNGYPDRTRNVEINSAYDTNSDSFNLEACNLLVDNELIYNGSTLKSVIVYNDLTINGNFVVGDTESLVMRNGVVNYTGTFTKIENSQIKQTVNDATYWSSPVEEANLKNNFSNADTNRMFELIPTSINPIYETSYPKYEHWFNYSGNMAVGMGYSVEGNIGSFPATQIVSFTGKPNNGFYNVNIESGISSTNQSNLNYNLIGNPYPSSIDPDIFINTNDGGRFTGTIYVWSQGAINGGVYQDADYFSYNLAGGAGTSIPEGANYKIASGQGFMIEAENTSSIVFNNEMRVIGENDMFYKSYSSKKSPNNKDERDRLWLQIISSNKKVKEQLIGFFSDATDGFDFGYDGKSISGNEYNFYSTLENNKYVIQGLDKFSIDKKIILGFDTEKADVFTISISKMEGVLKDQNIYLVDNLLSITTDLSKNDYTFSQTEIGEFTDRFTLQFATAVLGIDDVLTEELFVISSIENGIHVESSDDVKSIIVFDILGKKIIEENPNKSSFNLVANKIKTGFILIIQAQLENGVIINKKFIKN